MGTDIHAVAQARINGEWVDIESKFDEWRHYKLFAHLAGVRNGLGFAGVDTVNAVMPIQEHRGFPSDFEVQEDGYHGEEWMGDHSFGWVSAHEVINHDWDQGFSSGIIPIDAYRKWDGLEPKSYCGGAYGNGIVVVDDCEHIPDNATDVRVTWKNSADSFCYFVDEVVEMVKTNKADVRIVFGFDS